MLMKIICLVICAILLIISYKAKWFTQRVLRKEITDKLILNVKISAFSVAAIIFIITIILMK